MNPSSNHPALQRLLGGFDADRFVAEVYGKHPLHIPAVDADRFESLINWRDLERLLDMTGLWDESRLRLMADGRRLAPEQYSFALKSAEGEPRVWRAQPERVMQALRQGAALVLNGLDGLVPAIGSIAQALEEQLSVRVQSNLYLSMRGHRGLPLHYDIHDVLAIQISGRKQWRVYENRAHPSVKPAPERELRPVAGRVTHSMRLSPGDCLYLPAGMIHEAIADSERSLHLTFALKQITPLDLMSLLTRRLTVHDDFTRPSYDLHEGSDALARQVTRLAESMARIAASPTELASILSEIAAHHQPRGRYTLDPANHASDDPTGSVEPSRS